MSSHSSEDKGPEGRSDISPGTIVGRYTIIEKIGVGGIGEIYLALDTRLNRKVALKFIPAKSLRDKDCRDRLVAEAGTASQLNHPNIVTIYSIDSWKGIDFIVMEYIDGKSLRQQMHDESIPWNRTVAIIIQLCEALKAAHGVGIVHRDIKPENIIIDQNGVAKIIDFGLACYREARTQEETESLSGSMAYMSPEQIQNESLDHRTDLYSLGVVFYELLTGRPPFRGDYEAALSYSIVNTSPELLSKFRTDLPPGIQEIMNRLLSKKPDNRYQNADDIINDLNAIAETVRVAPGRHGRSVRWASGAVVIITIIILGLAFKNVFYHPAGRRKMLAVLPFKNLGSPEKIYFAYGIAENLTTSLARFSDLGVISNASAMRYENSDKPIKQIAAELNVDYILSGSVSWDSAGAFIMVKINCQLIRAPDATVIWADNYERVIDQIFAVQNEIAVRVVQAVVARTSIKSVAIPPVNDLRAYDCYLQGNYYYHRSWVEADYRRAIQMYTNAIKIDSDFVLAYVRLSEVHGSMFTDRYDRSSRRLALSKWAADKALEIDPDSPDGKLALGTYYYTTMQFDLALRYFDKIKKSLSNSPELFASIAGINRRQGKFRDAIANYSYSLALEPNSPLRAFDLGLTYSFLREYSRAEEYIDKAITLSPDWPLPYIYKAWIQIFSTGDKNDARNVLREASSKTDISRTEYYRYYWWLSTILDNDLNKTLSRITLGADTASYYLFRARTYHLMHDRQMEKSYCDSARAFLEIIAANKTEDPSVLSNLGLAYAGLGRYREAISEGKDAVDMLPVSRDAFDGQFLVGNLAQIYTMLGREDDAIKQLEFLLSKPGFVSKQYLMTDPIWKPLWDNPKFIKLVKR